MWKTECFTAQSAFSPGGWKLNADFDKHSFNLGSQRTRWGEVLKYFLDLISKLKVCMNNGDVTVYK